MSGFMNFSTFTRHPRLNQLMQICLTPLCVIAAIFAVATAPIGPTVVKGAKVNKFDAFDCANCSKPIALSEANTLIIRFTRQPYFDHLYVQCDCSYIIRYWVDEATFAQAEQAQCGVMRAEFAPEELVIAILRYRGFTYPPKTYNIPPTLAKACDHFAELLGRVPAELLWDEITSPAPKLQLPERWNND